MSILLLAVVSVAAAAPSEPAPLRVMTFNLWIGGEAGKQPLVQTARVIRMARADVVGLQETCLPDRRLQRAFAPRLDRGRREGRKLPAGRRVALDESHQRGRARRCAAHRAARFGPGPCPHLDPDDARRRPEGPPRPHRLRFLRGARESYGRRDRGRGRRPRADRRDALSVGSPRRGGGVRDLSPAEVSPRQNCRAPAAPP